MTLTATLDRYYKTRYLFFEWRSSLTLSKKLLLAFGLACLVGLLAQVRLVLPFTPVPVTGSTLGVVLAGLLLGRKWGGVSLALYAGLGFAGLPWFGGFGGGLGILLGPTGGYIIGFIPAALFIGYLSDTFVSARKTLPMLGIIMAAHVLFIYIPGMLGLGLWLGLLSGKSISLSGLLSAGCLPFIPGDIIKSVLAALTASAILPKRAFGDR